MSYLFKIFKNFTKVCGSSQFHNFQNFYVVKYLRILQIDLFTNN